MSDRDGSDDKPVDESAVPVVPKLRSGGFTGTRNEPVGWVHEGYSIVPDSVSDEELRVLRVKIWRSKMNSREQTIADIVARYDEWYSQEDEHRRIDSELWSGRGDEETVSHCIVRNDIPELLGLLGVEGFVFDG